MEENDDLDYSKNPFENSKNEEKEKNEMPKLPEIDPRLTTNIPPVNSSSFGAPRIDLSLLNNKVSTARTEIGKYLIGQHEMVDLLLIGVFCGGHVLLEGVPGIAKTLTA